MDQWESYCSLCSWREVWQTHADASQGMKAHHCPVGRSAGVVSRVSGEHAARPWKDPTPELEPAQVREHMTEHQRHVEELLGD